MAPSSSEEQLEASPSERAFTALREASTAELIEMRDLFEASLVACPPAAYHPVDVTRVRNDDWQLLRFLERTSSSQEAFNQLHEALIWKTTNAVHKKSDKDFPREFYQLNGLEVLGRNQEGNLVIWLTSQYNRDFTELKENFKAFIIHEIEYMDNQAGPYGLQIISDCKHVGLFSVDIELTRFMQDIISKYYPGCVRQTIITNLSMLLDPIYKLIVAFLSADLRATLKVVSRKNLKNIVDEGFIPEEYGGKRKDSVVRVPSESRSFVKYSNLKLTDSQKKRFKALFEKMDIK